MKAIDYIRKGWTCGSFAKDTKGYSILPNHPAAVCWCAHGAILAAYSDFTEREDAIEKLKKVIYDYGHEIITLWNDDRTRTKEEVLQAFEKAGI